MTTRDGGGASLDWEGMHNVRDLGGHPTPWGRTRFGAVICSEAPTLLTPAGRRQVVAHGVRGFLDLRSAEEAAEVPGPFTGDAGYVLVPILDHPAMEHVRTLQTAEQLFAYMVLDRSAGLAAALRALLRLSGRGGVLIHCRAGKDRTGVLAALLLANAGVSTEVIATDHARTRENIEPLYAYWTEQARDEAERALVSRRRFEATADSIRHMLGLIEERHGGVADYLGAIGLQPAEIEALRLILAPA